MEGPKGSLTGIGFEVLIDNVGDNESGQGVMVWPNTHFCSSAPHRAMEANGVFVLQDTSNLPSSHSKLKDKVHII